VNAAQVLSIDGGDADYASLYATTPAMKDVVVVPRGGSVTLLVPIKDFTGMTMYHCHILEHEDIGMMGMWNIMEAGMSEGEGESMNEGEGESMGEGEGENMNEGEGESMGEGEGESQGEVILKLVSPQNPPVAGTTFNVVIEVLAGTRKVDGAVACLDFDPALLNVVEVVPGTALPMVLQNTTSPGQVNFSAKAASGFPGGTFTLATVQFKALTASSSVPIRFCLAEPRKSDVTFAGSILTQAADGSVSVAAAMPEGEAEGEAVVEGEGEGEGGTDQTGCFGGTAGDGTSPGSTTRGLVEDVLVFASVSFLLSLFKAQRIRPGV
jgi:hypothetical protein